MVAILDIALYPHEIIVIRVNTESGITEHLRCNILSWSDILKSHRVTESPSQEKEEEDEEESRNYPFFH